MTASKQQVINFLETRYDYLSARNVINNWLKESGARDLGDPVSDAELKSLASYLQVAEPAATSLHRMISNLILSDGVGTEHVEESLAVEPAVRDEQPAVEEPQTAIEEIRPVEEDQAQPSTEQQEAGAPEQTDGEGEEGNAPEDSQEGTDSQDGKGKKRKNKKH